MHVYLHRKEGDLETATHWYWRAGRTTIPDIPLGREWEQIAANLFEAAADSRK